MEYPTKGEHVLIVGQNGSGKSVMLQHLLRQADISPVFVIDSKIDNGFLALARPDESMIIFSDGLYEFAKWIGKTPARKIPDYVIIRPPASEAAEPFVLDKYLELIHAHYRAPCITAIDELYMLHRGGRAGAGLTGMLTRGRSVDHRLYGCSQRPGWISRFCLSEPSHYYVFRLIDVEDRKRLRHIGYDDKKTLDNYHFFEYHVKSGIGEYSEPLDVPDSYLSENVSDSGRWL